MAKAPDDDLSPEELAAREEKLEDLTEGLKQAKRKPRHFAIVASGTEILSLQLQKKPFRDGPLRRERRDEGGRQIYEGICQGTKGTTIVFKFEDALPKFKRFITEKTGLVLQPEFAFLSAAAPSLRR